MTSLSIFQVSVKPPPSANHFFLLLQASEGDAAWHMDKHNHKLSTASSYIFYFFLYTAHWNNIKFFFSGIFAHFFEGHKSIFFGRCQYGMSKQSFYANTLIKQDKNAFFTSAYFLSTENGNEFFYLSFCMPFFITTRQGVQPIISWLGKWWFLWMCDLARIISW